MSDTFYSSNIGKLVDSCNTLTDRACRVPNGFYLLAEEYPNLSLELLSLSGNANIDPNLSERFLAFSNAWLSLEDNSILSLLWDDCINGLCIYAPEVERYVLSPVLSYEDSTVKSGYIPSPRLLNEAINKAITILKNKNWTSRTVLMIKGKMNNAMIDTLIAQNLLTVHPQNQDWIALSRGALVNPNFTGIWK